MISVQWCSVGAGFFNTKLTTLRATYKAVSVNEIMGLVFPFGNQYLLIVGELI